MSMNEILLNPQINYRFLPGPSPDVIYFAMEIRYHVSIFPFATLCVKHP